MYVRNVSLITGRCFRAVAGELTPDFESVYIKNVHPVLIKSAVTFGAACGLHYVIQLFPPRATGSR